MPECPKCGSSNIQINGEWGDYEYSCEECGYCEDIRNSFSSKQREKIEKKWSDFF